MPFTNKINNKIANKGKKGKHRDKKTLYVGVSTCL